MIRARHAVLVRASAARDLAPMGGAVVLGDLAGCGRSDGPPFDGRTIAGHARLICGLIDDLVIARAGLVGHGIGATIALQLALDQPMRVSGVPALAARVVRGLGLAARARVVLGTWPRWLGRLARASGPAAGIFGAAVIASFLHGSALRGYVD